MTNLPESWTFPRGETRALAQACGRARLKAPDIMPALSQQVRQQHNLEVFGERFSQTILQLASKRGNP